MIRGHRVSSVFALMSLLAVVVIGCGQPDPEQGDSSGADGSGQRGGSSPGEGALVVYDVNLQPRDANCQPIP